MRLWYLSHRRSAKAPASLRFCAVSPQPLLFAQMKNRNQTSSPTGWLRMRVWRMSLRRMKRTIISRDGSFHDISPQKLCGRAGVRTHYPWIEVRLQNLTQSAKLSSPADKKRMWKLSCLMTKPTKWSVHPVKTQISLGIHPVWSESSQCTQ